MHTILVPAPDDKQPSKRIAVLEDGKLLFARSEGFVSVWEQGRPILDATDSDNDGFSEKLSYTAYMNGYDHYIMVEDRNADGQPDIKKLQLPGETTEWWVWIQGDWYRLTRLGSRQVWVNGQVADYEVMDREFVFASEKQPASK
jgi:hypothetical protein